MKLWPHQERALKELAEAIQAGERRICLTSPTGGGKTKIATEHIINSGLPSEFITHRKMLLAQTSDRFQAAGILYGIRAAGYPPTLMAGVQVSMVQSEYNRVNKGRPVHGAHHVLIDECHAIKAKQVQTLLEAHQEAYKDYVKIGLTATPLGLPTGPEGYTKLIVAGTNRELRDCGALVPAHHKAPDEPDKRWIGTVKVDDGECGISMSKRDEYCHRVFGSVIDHYHQYNPDGRPAILFAPDVKGSRWFAQQLSKNGIPAAHIDATGCWVDGYETDNDQDMREMIAEGSRTGRIKVVCNRFVLREGIDWPWIYHGILATVFGSLSAYIQAGGRILRAHESLNDCLIQDHGGNWWRHGSLNCSRQWELTHNDRIVSGMRLKNIREDKEPEPIVCPECETVRSCGACCPECGFRWDKRTRRVLQKDGTLKEMGIQEFRPRRRISDSERVRRTWMGQVRGTRNSPKPSMKTRTFAQVEASFARDHQWQYPPRDIPGMPIDPTDWFRPVKEVPEERLT